MAQVRAWIIAVVTGSALVACSSNGATPNPGPIADAGADTSAPPVTDSSVPPITDASDTSPPGDENPRATSCTAPPFVNFTATLTSLDLAGTSAPLAGATVTFSTCSGFNLTTDANGAATTQITQGIPVSPIYYDGTTVIGAIGAEIPAAVDVAPKVTVFASDVAPAIPGFQQDGGNAPTIAMFLQADPTATGACASTAGVTLAVTSHAEAVVSYANAGWPANPAVTTTSSTGPYVFINGITGASHVTVTGTKSGCTVNIVTASQTGNFVLVQGSVTVGLATITN